MLEKLRRKSRDPSVNPYQRMMDPDLGMPRIFYMMDEIGKVQVLRKFRKCESEFGGMSYCGTYKVLYKTQRLGKFCIVMRRIQDEWGVPEDHRIQDPEELKSLVIAEYYPGVMSRIYMKGLPEETVKDILDDYFRRMLRKKRRPLLDMV